VSNENLLSLKAKLTKIAAERLAGQDLSPTIYIDAEIPQGELRPEHFVLCQRLEPIGAGNPEPLFLSPGLAVRESRVVGDQHLKLTLADGGFVWDGIAFGMGDSLPDLASRIDVVFTPQLRIYRDKEQLQLRIEDWRPSA
jgi:single-stranded-DNA-specific exonuclease